MNKVILVGRTIEFPSPLEVYVIFYMKKITLKNGNVIVSGPYRGLGGFLPIQLSCWDKEYLVSVPSRGMGGFLQELKSNGK